MDEVTIVEDILYSQYEDSSYQDLANIPLPSFCHCGIWQELKAGLPAEQEQLAITARAFVMVV